MYQISFKRANVEFCDKLARKTAESQQNGSWKKLIEQNLKIMPKEMKELILADPYFVFYYIFYYKKYICCLRYCNLVWRKKNVLFVVLGSLGDGGGQAGGLGHGRGHGLRLSPQGGNPRQASGF